MYCALGIKVGAEGRALLVAVCACAEAAEDLALAQVSGDSPGWLTVHLAETAEAVTAASRHAVQKLAKQFVHHATRLAVRAAVSVALELPCGEAADVDMKYFQSRAAAVVAELNLNPN